MSRRRATEPLLPPSMRAVRITPGGLPAVALPAGLILAGGASRRMGRPKALLRLAGETFVERLCRLLRAAGCDEIVVVVGADARAIGPAVPGAARVVVNGDWRRGMRSSLRAGLRALPPGPVILTHVDRPLVERETLRRLVATPGTAIPTLDGRGGHPVRLGADLRPRLLAGDGRPLSDIIQQARPTRVPVGDGGILININTPVELRALRARTAPHADESLPGLG